MIRLIQKHNLVLINPWHPCLHTTLIFKRRVKDKKWPFNYKYLTERLYHKDPRNDFGFAFGGLLPDIVRRLSVEGIPHQVEDHRAPLTPAVFDRIQYPLRSGQPEVLATIASSHRGIIKCPPGWGKSFIICQLCRMYPGAKILVITTRESVYKSLYKRISADKELVVNRVKSALKYKPESDVLVTTSGSMHKVGQEWPDIMIFDEVHGAGSPTLRMIIPQFSTDRIYGFSATPEGRSDNSDIQVRALFGDIICNISYQDAQAAGVVPKVQVRIVESKGDELGELTTVKRNALGYWNNVQRNQDIFRAVRDADIIPRQTLILTATLEHAVRLKGLLPEYTVIHAGADKGKWVSLFKSGALWQVLAQYDTLENRRACALSNDMAETALDSLILHTCVISNPYIIGLLRLSYKDLGIPDRDKILEGFETGKLQKVIATTVWKEGVDFPDLSCVVRADGMAGQISSIQMGGRLTRLSENDKVLIDFTDNYGHSLETRAQERLRIYRKEGWEIVNWNPCAVQI